FSSRRRHTRSLRDWSSDVCSSDLVTQAWNLSWFSVIGSNIFSNVPFVLVAGKWITRFVEPVLMWKVLALATTFAGNLTIVGSVRSEERRVGKEWWVRRCVVQ